MICPNCNNEVTISTKKLSWRCSNCNASGIVFKDNTLAITSKYTDITQGLVISKKGVKGVNVRPNLTRRKIVG